MLGLIEYTIDGHIRGGSADLRDGRPWKAKWDGSGLWSSSRGNDSEWKCGLGDDGLMMCGIDQTLCGSGLIVLWDWSTKLGRWYVWVHGLKHEWLMLLTKYI